MNITVLSGKGGTGKTTIATNLYTYLENSTLLDTDVEEPNASIFLRGDKNRTYNVTKQYPIVDIDKCTHCNKCGIHCNFNAIVPTKRNVLVFDDLCHSCGLCQLVCPAHAITYKEKTIGTITAFNDQNKTYYEGTLQIGEISGVKIIDTMIQLTKKDDIIIKDAPPGVSCSVVASLRDTDYAIVVTEPTPFGLSDMKMVLELLNTLHIPHGVVINKYGLGSNHTENYLIQKNISILTKIPFQKKRAEMYSTGNLIIENDTSFAQHIKEIVETIFGESYV